MRGLKLKCSLETTLSVCLFKYWVKQFEKENRSQCLGIINTSSVAFALKVYDFNNFKKSFMLLFIVRKMYLDNFGELFHPPSTRCVIPGFTLHAVLHFPHTNLSLPAAVNRVHYYIPVLLHTFKHMRTDNKLELRL